MTNEYMNTMVDLNKSHDGIETQRVGENTACQIDIRKAVALIKLKTRRNEKNGC